MISTVINDAYVLAQVRAFLLQNIVGPGVSEVIGDVDNRVSMSKNQYITMNHLGKTRLSTNQDTYNLEASSVKFCYRYGLQLDCVGANAGDWATAISALWFDPFTCDFFSLFGMAPLWAADPRHAPWTNGEGQWESRWIVDVFLQVNSIYPIPSQVFGGPVEIGIVAVDGGNS